MATDYDITMGNDVARDAHCEITMGNDIARDIHCDVTMSNDVAMCTYHGITIRDVLIHYFLLTILSAYHRDTHDNIGYCRPVRQKHKCGHDLTNLQHKRVCQRTSAPFCVGDWSSHDRTQLEAILRTSVFKNQNKTRHGDAF